jgi:hypothetical protein
MFETPNIYIQQEPTTEQFTPLVFNDTINTYNMTNVLLIDSTIADKQVFYDSANTKTFPIIYDSASKTADLIALLRQKFHASSIQRFALVFHGRGGNFTAPFMNNKKLFEECDLVENQTSFTENVSFLISCIKEFHVGYIDFLACNTLQYSIWQKYYSLLASQTAVVIGASNDPTGNIKYGGDWVMENTRQNIQQIYFTDSIEYYKYLLDTYTLNDIIYTYNVGAGNPASVTGYIAGLISANIPSTIVVSSVTYNVTSIETNAFRSCTSLTSVTIPSSVATIGNDAFRSCTSLTSVTIPSSVTSIGITPFNNCTSLMAFSVDASNANYSNDAFGVLFNKLQTSLIQYPIGNTQTSYNIPSSVASIEYGVFQGCVALTSVTIPSSVISIGSFAFANCTALTSLNIPSSVTTILIFAFDTCSALTAFSVDASNANYSNDAFGVLFNKLQTSLIQYPIGNTRASYNIPSSVASIDFRGFRGCIALTSVTIPSSVTTIGSFSFSNCTSLTSVTIPSSVTSIVNAAFNNCTSLTAFAVDASNANYSNDVFGVLFNKLKTSLIQYPIGNTQTSYNIPSSVASIGYGGFEGCVALTSVSIPSSVISIGLFAFNRLSGLMAFVVDASNPNYSSDVYGVLFDKSKLRLIQYPIGNPRTSYTIPSSVTSIGSYSFANCTALTSVTIPSLVTTIESSSFANCTALTSVNIPSFVTGLQISAFENCISLTSVNIPSSVTSINQTAFFGCSNLNLVYFLRTPLLPTIGINAFTGIKNTSVGKYYANVTNAPSITPYFNSTSTITLPTLTSMTAFNSTSPSAVVVISYANLVANSNASVDSGLTYVFLVNSVSSGSLSIGATQESATPWNASTNKTIASGTNAYWTPVGVSSSLWDSFSLVIRDSLGNESSPNVLVQIAGPYPCFLEGTKILSFENNEEVYLPIESLRKGDLVKTIYNGYMPIHMIGTTALYNPGNDYRVANRLYKCPREKYPTLFEDLYITGCHSILVPSMTDDQWENTKAANGDVFVTDNHFRLVACADEKAEPFNKEGFMNIYHIALEHHDILMNYGIYANGLLVESCSERNLRELSNMRILEEEDSSICQDMYVDGGASNNISRQLVDTY